MILEEAIRFDSNGNALFGVLSLPEQRDGSGTGVLLLSPGLKHRVGPHRLHNKLARLFAENGLPVFRFDFHGTGDAEGELPADGVPELHEMIQTGYFTDDSLAAVELFCARAKIDSVIACGLCGGAISGVFLAAREPRVSAIVGFQLPVKLIDQEEDFADQISGEFSDFILGLYLKKLVNPTAWKNFLGGKSEYSLIWKTAWRRLARLLRIGGGDKPRASVPPGFNRPFLSAYEEIAGRVEMCWIYSEQERARYDFESDFEGACLIGKPRPFEKHVIANSNHEFAPDDAQAELFETIESWLRRRRGRERRVG